MSIDIQMTTEQVPGPAIHVHALEKSYDELHVLRGVDFDVARGGIFALLGSNGAGKTTVVRILSTLLKADAGTVIVSGFDVARQAANVRESISLTGQFAAVDEILTGRENLILIARLRRVADARPLADDLFGRLLLTTQYLDEAEQLADRIAILQEGRIIANGTLAELKQLLPPAKVEYVEKQPTLEEVFLAVVGAPGPDADATAASAPTRKEQR